MGAVLAGHLAALQLADSAFPSGRYTLSYGLEAIAQSGMPADLVELLSDGVRLGVAPSDGVALACAHRAVGADGRIDLDLVARVDERLTAVKLAREARQASARTGRALLGTATTALGVTAMADYADRVAAGRCPGNHAVVLGVLSAALGVPRLEAVAGELYAVCAGWVAAAVRLALTDHRTAQGVLHRVRPVIAEAAAAAVDRDVTGIGGCTPLLDLMSMRHEQAELRLFAS
ncbi:urease accessory protein UreF [Pseudonocardia sp. DLS-67]